VGGDRPVSRPVPRRAGRAAGPVRASAGLGALVVLLGATALVAGCVPTSPDDQTTDVDVARYRALAADPWLAATDLAPGKWLLGTDREFTGGTASFVRTVTGSVRDVLVTEADAAARAGWTVVGARCPGDDLWSTWAHAVSVRVARALDDGSAAFATFGVAGDDPAVGVDDEGATRTVRGLAGVAHHTAPDDDVPEAVDLAAALDTLSCLGGDGGVAVGDVVGDPEGGR